jgi:DNA-binding transcriptional MocR family regulator
MSYKDRLSELEREGDTSITAQIVAAIEGAIADGEVMPGDKLPPTRELAELAGVNHLTAARAYRRLAEGGAVVSRVGSGTYVRGTAALAQEPPPAGRPRSSSWQRYALPEDRRSFADAVIGDIFASSAHAAAGPDGLIPLISGYPSERLFPTERLAELTEAALARAGSAAWQYAPPEGVWDLREAIAGLAAADGLDDPLEHVIVSSGARQGLLLVARAICGPGDAVACESPSFAGVVSAMRSTGAEVLPVPSDGDGLDVDVLEQLLRRHEIKLLTLQPRLQNPTGRDLESGRRERLVELARRHGFFLLEDAVYSPLRLEGSEPGPLRAAAPEHVIYVNSLSKTVSPGLRAGWVIASGPVLARIAAEKQNDDMTGPTLPQLIATDFISDREGYQRQIESAKDFHRLRRAALGEAIDRQLAGLATPLHEPLGGAHFWLRLDEPLDERALYAEAIRNGVNFMPGSAATPEPPFETHIRLSFSYLEPEQLREGVRRLGVAIRALRRREAAAPAGALPIV